MEELRGIELHIGQDQLMCHLDFHGELSQVQLMTCLNCEASTVSNMVKALERQGLLTKRKSQTDSRSTVIKLTAKGEEKIPFIHDSWQSFQTKMLLNISETDQQQLLALLTQIKQNIKK